MDYQNNIKFIMEIQKYRKSYKSQLNTKGKIEKTSDTERQTYYIRNNVKQTKNRKEQNQANRNFGSRKKTTI